MLISEKCPRILPNYHLSSLSYSLKQSYGHITAKVFWQQFQRLHQHPQHLISKFTCVRTNRLHSTALKAVAKDFNLQLMCLSAYLRALKRLHFQTSSLVLLLANFQIIFLMNFKGFQRFSHLLLNIIHFSRSSQLTKNFSNF